MCRSVSAILNSADTQARKVEEHPNTCAIIKKQTETCPQCSFHMTGFIPLNFFMEANPRTNHQNEIVCGHIRQDSFGFRRQARALNLLGHQHEFPVARTPGVS